MADTKISALTAAAAAAVTNEIQINEAGTTKKITVEQLRTLLGVQKACMTGSAHSNSTTTGTAVTDLTVTLPSTGTFVFTYLLIVRSSATGTGLGFSINCTAGAVTKMVVNVRYASTGTTASSGVADDAINAVGGQLYESQASKTMATTAPNMIFGGVATSASDTFIVVEGVVVTTTSAGTLELWHSSETAVATTVEVGSSLSVMKMA